MQHGAKMENLAKFPQAILAGCPVLCGQMCHHCDTCLWFSHRLISAPRGSGHPGRHQLGLNSGAKLVPHTWSGDRADGSFYKCFPPHHRALGRAALPLETSVLCHCSAGESAQRTDAALVSTSAFVFCCCFIKTNENQKKKPPEAFDSVNTISELGLI